MQSQPSSERVPSRPALVESEAFLREQILTYIGNKRALLGFIGEGVSRVKARLGRDRIDALDVFSGSGVVARYLKQHCRRIIVCDLEHYSSVVNSCYLANSAEVDLELLARLVDRLNRAAVSEPCPGTIAELYAPLNDTDIQPGERVFYTRENAVRIDTLRAFIDEEVPEELRVFALAPLLYAASVHANTSGVFKGFYKNSATGLGQFGGNGRNALARICKPISLQVPVLSRFTCEFEVHCGDASRIVPDLNEVDLAYLDPPYNQHPYGSNYFMLNLIAEHRRPDAISTISGIPSDWNRSDFNKKSHALASLTRLIDSVRSRFLLISFNSEGFISRQEMSEMLAERGRTEVLQTQYNAFRGSRNLSNRELHVSEFLFLLDRG
jgi:adenine-specific DNA-methyltransferase